MVTALVTPLMVRSPVSSKAGRAGLASTPVETKVISGYSSMAEEVVAAQVARRAAALRVSMLAAWMVSVDAWSRRVGAVDDGGALELVERAADLGHHRVPGDEADAGVRGVDGLGAGEVGKRGGRRGAVAVVVMGAPGSGGHGIGDVSLTLLQHG